MCEEAPMPPWASFKASPRCRSTAMNSFKSCAGKSLRAITTAGEWAVMPIGTKSTTGSYLTFGVSTDTATCEPIAGATDILDNEGLPKRPGHLVGDDARHHIAGASRRERHDHGDRPGRVVLRAHRHDARNQCHRDDDRRPDANP